MNITNGDALSAPETIEKMPRIDQQYRCEGSNFLRRASELTHLCFPKMTQAGRS